MMQHIKKVIFYIASSLAKLKLTVAGVGRIGKEAGQLQRYWLRINVDTLWFGLG